MMKLWLKTIQFQQRFIYGLIQLVFDFIHLALFVQQFSKDLSISHHTSLRKENLVIVGVTCYELAQLIHSCYQCKVLKGIGPSLRILIVGVEQIEGVNLLPDMYRFLGDDNIRQALTDEPQKGGLTASNIPLNRVYYFPHILSLIVIIITSTIHLSTRIYPTPYFMLLIALMVKGEWRKEG